MNQDKGCRRNIPLSGELIKTIENPSRLIEPPCPRISHGKSPTAFLVRQLLVFELLNCLLEVTLLQIDPAYPGVIPTEVRVALEHHLKLRQRFVVAALKVKKRPDVAVDRRRERIRQLRPFQFRESFIHPSLS